jgi:hypothetical protein
MILFLQTLILLSFKSLYTAITSETASTTNDKKTVIDKLTDTFKNKPINATEGKKIQKTSNITYENRDLEKDLVQLSNNNEQSRF